ncbi:AraC-type DNA-binding domain and AraC-containing proteins [Pseudomonas aeruginosa]|nr:AraC-type DNA-binding domain and AraC-containing proteins [Pseudomonas aeruginosa]CAI9909120.1 AraC-type DNA-binding domain and AraC-containing proteins [Pseudomonas aeruginosa]
MIDSTFSRATWLNSLHMSTLTLSLLEKEGFAREQLLEGSGITPADLLDLRRLISPWQEQQVFANACRLSDEPALGLRLGLRTRISAYGLLGYALLSAPTLGEALRIGLSYPVLLGTYFHLSLEVADGRAWLVATGYGEDEALRPFNTELCLGSLKVTCADLLGQPLPLLEAAFDYAGDEAMARAYAEGFACELHFERERSAIGFAAEWLERPLPLADPVTHREMLEQCRRQNIDLAARRAWLDKVRAILAERLQDPPGLEELARRLNCSSRSLRRHLQQQRTSYQQLLDELRFARAKELLQSGDMPIYRIAEELGFSETASLRHAFQRWSGQPPSHFRARALAQAEGLVSAWRRRRSSATSPRDFAAPSPIQAMKARSKRKSAPHSPTRKRRTSWALR